MKCPSCGVENPEGSRFCMSCGSPLSTEASQASAPPMPLPPPPPPPLAPPWARHRQPHEDVVGLVSLAFVLVALSFALAQNPNLVADMGQWFHLIATHNTPFVRPPEGVIVAAAWFFGIIGVLEFVAAGLRGALRWTPLRVAGRVLSGFGDLVFSALLVLYSARTITGTLLIAVLAGTVGVLLLVYVTLGLYWSSMRGVPRPESVEPPARQG